MSIGSPNGSNSYIRPSADAKGLRLVLNGEKQRPRMPLYDKVPTGRDSSDFQAITLTDDGQQRTFYRAHNAQLTQIFLSQFGAHASTVEIDVAMRLLAKAQRASTLEELNSTLDQQQFLEQSLPSVLQESVSAAKGDEEIICQSLQEHMEAFEGLDDDIKLRMGLDYVAGLVQAFSEISTPQDTPRFLRLHAQARIQKDALGKIVKDKKKIEGTWSKLNSPTLLNRASRLKAGIKKIKNEIHNTPIKDSLWNEIHLLTALIATASPTERCELSSSLEKFTSQGVSKGLRDLVGKALAHSKADLCELMSSTDSKKAAPEDSLKKATGIYEKAMAHASTVMALETVLGHLDELGSMSQVRGQLQDQFTLLENKLLLDIKSSSGPMAILDAEIPNDLEEISDLYLKLKNLPAQPGVDFAILSARNLNSKLKSTRAALDQAQSEAIKKIPKSVEGKTEPFDRLQSLLQSHAKAQERVSSFQLVESSMSLKENTQILIQELKESLVNLSSFHDNFHLLDLARTADLSEDLIQVLLDNQSRILKAEELQFNSDLKDIQIELEGLSTAATQDLENWESSPSPSASEHPYVQLLELRLKYDHLLKRHLLLQSDSNTARELEGLLAQIDSSLPRGHMRVLVGLLHKAPAHEAHMRLLETTSTSASAFDPKNIAASQQTVHLHRKDKWVLKACSNLASEEEGLADDLAAIICPGAIVPQQLIRHSSLESLGQSLLKSQMDKDHHYSSEKLLSRKRLSEAEGQESTWDLLLSCLPLDSEAYHLARSTEDLTLSATAEQSPSSFASPTACILDVDSESSSICTIVEIKNRYLAGSLPVETIINGLSLESHLRKRTSLGRVLLDRSGPIGYFVNDLSPYKTANKAELRTIFSEYDRKQWVYVDPDSGKVSEPIQFRRLHALFKAGKIESDALAHYRTLSRDSASISGDSIDQSRLQKALKVNWKYIRPELTLSPPTQASVGEVKKITPEEDNVVVKPYIPTLLQSSFSADTVEGLAPRLATEQNMMKMLFTLDLGFFDLHGSNIGIKPTGQLFEAYQDALFRVAGLTQDLTAEDLVFQVLEGHVNINSTVSMIGKSPEHPENSLSSFSMKLSDLQLAAALDPAHPWEYVFFDCDRIMPSTNRIQYRLCNDMNQLDLMLPIRSSLLNSSIKDRPLDESLIDRIIDQYESKLSESRQYLSAANSAIMRALPAGRRPAFQKLLAQVLRSYSPTPIVNQREGLSIESKSEFALDMASPDLDLWRLLEEGLSKESYAVSTGKDASLKELCSEYSMNEEEFIQMNEQLLGQVVLSSEEGDKVSLRTAENFSPLNSMEKETLKTYLKQANLRIPAGSLLHVPYRPTKNGAASKTLRARLSKLLYPRITPDAHLAYELRIHAQKEYLQNYRQLSRETKGFNMMEACVNLCNQPWSPLNSEDKSKLEALQKSSGWSAVRTELIELTRPSYFNIAKTMFPLLGDFHLICSMLIEAEHPHYSEAAKAKIVGSLVGQHRTTVLDVLDRMETERATLSLEENERVAKLLNTFREKLRNAIPNSIIENGLRQANVLEPQN